jgi:hypothetical protein
MLPLNGFGGSPRSAASSGHDDPQCRVDAAHLVEAEVSEAFA